MEKHKIVVRIQGKDYTIVSSEEDEYVQRVSLHVDKKMNEILLKNPSLSTAMAAVLTAINISDEYCKSVKNAENMRLQIAEYLEEAKKAQAEKNKLLFDNENLREEIHKLQIELAKAETEIAEHRRKSSYSQNILP